MGLAFVDIAAYDIDPNAALLLSNDLMRKYTILPIKIQDDDLVVAMADPANIFAIDDLRIVTGKEIRFIPDSTSDTRGVSMLNGTIDGAQRLSLPFDYRNGAVQRRRVLRLQFRNDIL